MQADESSYTQLDGGRIGLRRFHRGAPELLCFPHAGAQSLAFSAFAAALHEHGIGCAAVDPPGHGWAGGEPLRSMPALVRAYLDALPSELASRSILFGHSMGAYVALGLVLALHERGHAPPAVILSAARPPHLRPKYAPLARMPDAELLATLVGLGGVPDNVVTIFDRFAPAIRADFEALETCPSPTAICRIPTLVLGGSRDPFCLPEHVVEWSAYLHRFQTRWIEAEHLFVQTHAHETAGRVAAFVRTLVAEPQS